MGPALRPRRAPGRPTVDTPEIRDRIFELLGDGVPLRVICRSPGMASRRTVYNWRRDDPGFDRAFEFMQTEGYIGLAQKVMEEMETILEQRGPKIARWVFNLRRQQLSRMITPAAQFSSRRSRLESIMRSVSRARACARSCIETRCMSPDSVGLVTMKRPGEETNDDDRLCLCGAIQFEFAGEAVETPHYARRPLYR